MVGGERAILERIGLGRLRHGAAWGLAGGIAAGGAPAALLLVDLIIPGDAVTPGAGLIRLIGALLLLGAVLLAVSLFLYRRGFAALRTVDRRLALAANLCLVGTVGAILLFVADVLVLGASDTLANCIGGRSAASLDCLRSGQPLGTGAAVVGLALGWIGDLGIVIGLMAAGRRTAHAPLRVAGVAYAALLLVFAGPVVALVAPVARTSYVFLALVALLLLAPALVRRGTRSGRRR